MLFNYDVPTISTNITLFKARDVISPFDEYDDPYNNWKKFTDKPIRVYTVNGYHESMLEKENVKVIASTICSITMDEAEYV